MEPKNYLNGSGMLRVGGGHSIYWEDWGNARAKVPIFFLHGGPGGGFRESDKLSFDPLRQRVIFFDQRGAGKSKLLGTVENNTTQDLISDIDKLRKHLNIGVISLAGGSWGSTLALCYAIANPEVVQRMVIWGIFLAREVDNDYSYKGTGQEQHFPDAWQRFISMVPELERGDPVSYFAKQFEHRDKAVQKRYVTEWGLYDDSVMSIDDQIERKVLESEPNDEDYEKDLACAKIEAHYFSNKCFIEGNHILKNAKSIRHIPTVIVHGRYDFACSPSGAFELSQLLGDNCYLHIVPSNHSRSDAVLREVVKAYNRSFLL